MDVAGKRRPRVMGEVVVRSGDGMGRDLGPANLGPEARERRERLRDVFDTTLLIEGSSVTNGADPVYLALVEADLRSRWSGSRRGRPLYAVVMEDAAPLVNSRFVAAGRPGQISIRTSRMTPASAVAALRQAGVLVTVEPGGQIDLAAVLDDLEHAGVELVLVEGSDGLTVRLLADRLVDDLTICLVPPGAVGGSLARARPLRLPAGARLELTQNDTLDGDTAILYYVVHYA